MDLAYAFYINFAIFIFTQVTFASPRCVFLFEQTPQHKQVEFTYGKPTPETPFLGYDHGALISEFRKISEEFLAAPKENLKPYAHLRTIIQDAILLSHRVRSEIDNISGQSFPEYESEIKRAIEISEAFGGWKNASYFTKIRYDLKTAVSLSQLTFDKVREFFVRAALPHSFKLWKLRNAQKRYDSFISSKDRYVDFPEFFGSGSNFYFESRFAIPWYTSDEISVPELNALLVEWISPIWYPMRTGWVDGFNRDTFDTANHDRGHHHFKYIWLKVPYYKGHLTVRSETLLSFRHRLRQLYLAMRALDEPLRSQAEMAFYFAFHEHYQLVELYLNCEKLAEHMASPIIYLGPPKGTMAERILGLIDNRRNEVDRLINPQDQQGILPPGYVNASPEVIAEFLNAGRKKLSELMLLHGCQ